MKLFHRKKGETPDSEGKPPKKPNIFLRFLALLLTIALMLGALALVVFRDQLNFDALSRYLTYRDLVRSDTGQVQAFHHGSGTQSGYATLVDDLFIWSGNGVKLYSASGVNYLTDYAVFQNPIAEVNGDRAVVYDAGGLTLRVYQDHACVFALDLDEGYELMSAHLNGQGYLTITTQAPGYKGAVTVYNADYQALVSQRISSAFVLDGLLSDDGKTLGIVTAGQSGTEFQCTLSLYSMDDDAPFATASLGSSITLDIIWMDSAFWAVSQGQLTVVNAAGTITGEYDYSDAYLKAFSLEGDGFATLYIGPYRAGSYATLYTIGSDGVILAELDMNEQLLALDSAGRYVSLLTASGLEIFTKDLTTYTTLDTASGVQDIVLRSDGTAYLVSSDEAQLYIP